MDFPVRRFFIFSYSPYLRAFSLLILFHDRAGAEDGSVVGFPLGGWVGEGCCAVFSDVRDTAFVLGDGMEVLTQ